MRHHSGRSLRFKSQGFTIVELLIVVVVIAILAAITVVAYNGITKQATESVLKSDLQQVSTQLGMIKAKDGAYPDNDSGLKVSSGTGLQYTKISDDAFCATAQAKGQSFYLNSTSGQIEPGQCSTHTPPVAGGGGGAPVTMQTFTQSACSALAVYDGSNPAALVSLTDLRGGAVQTYTVGKLADDNCWMLDNLKLGSETGPITLTSTDSDVASSFTLPQLISEGALSFDTPTVAGPMPGDSGEGDTNYGYSYNWPAATAGESVGSMGPGGLTAPYSICPKGWRLPTAVMDLGGAFGSGDFPDLDRAFGGSGGLSQDGELNIGKWNYTGPFRGVMSGYWAGAFVAQGQVTYLWSSSTARYATDMAAAAVVTEGAVRLEGASAFRDGAISVRCLLR